MEGILFDIESFASPAILFAGLVLLGCALGGMFLGYTSDADRRGERLPWAEWPIPGTEVTGPPEAAKYPRAA